MFSILCIICFAYPDVCTLIFGGFNTVTLSGGAQAAFQQRPEIFQAGVYGQLHNEEKNVNILIHPDVYGQLHNEEKNVNILIYPVWMIMFCGLLTAIELWSRFLIQGFPKCRALKTVFATVSCFLFGTFLKKEKGLPDVFNDSKDVNFVDVMLSLEDFKKNASYKCYPLLCEFIATVSDLTVLVNVKLVDRIRIFLHRFRLFWGNRRINGTGIVYQMEKYSQSKQHRKYEFCPCQKCFSQGLKAATWAEIKIMTAAHLMSGNLKNYESSCRFYFDSPSELGISVDVVGIEEIDIKNNWCLLNCVTCDLNLITRLDVAMEKFDDLRLRVYETYKPTLMRDKSLFIVSHPYGTHKFVSFGQLKDISEVDEIWSKLTYNIKTFPGSAGAYVHLLGYSGKVWHYPHLHQCDNYSGRGFQIK